MQIEFDKEYLKELFVAGVARNKKYRFQNDVVRNYVKIIYIMMIFNRIEDFFKFRSLRFEALTNSNGLYSVRINKQYRLEFTLDLEVSEPVIKLCTILEISNHYE